MSAKTGTPHVPEELPLAEETARSLLDQLLEDSKLYRQSSDYFALLSFTARLRNFAPFNAMLLHIQKPGLSYAASALDWKDRFGRRPKPHARPLLILWPFGPVALVYDVQDTEGKDLPQGTMSFPAYGAIDEGRLTAFAARLSRKRIECVAIDSGDRKAGSIEAGIRSTESSEERSYRIYMNRNHIPATRFATLAHELGHLCLGHLGADEILRIPQRAPLTHVQQELEAESLTYLVCARSGVETWSESYLSNYVAEHTTVGALDVYQVMRGAGQVEALLGLTAFAKFDAPGPHHRAHQPDQQSLAAVTKPPD